MSKSCLTEAITLTVLHSKDGCFCDILDLVNCVLLETRVLMLFSTCMTEIFLISIKGPESVKQHCNLTAIYYQSRKLGFILQ